MDRADLDRVKNRLLQLQSRLERDSQYIIDNLPDVLHPPGAVTDIPTHNADHDVEGLDVEIATAKVQDHLREHIAAALARIDEGRYGTCESCGTHISTERLNAIPYTPFCITCEEKVEQEGRVGQDWNS